MKYQWELKISIDVRILFSYFSVYEVEITELINHTEQLYSFTELEGTLESATEHSWTIGANYGFFSPSRQLQPPLRDRYPNI